MHINTQTPSQPALRQDSSHWEPSAEPGLHVRIHRGTQEIGGTCIELSCAGKRLVLDLGRPLSAGRDEVVPLPPVPGLANGDDESLLGVLISHPHQDHWGLLDQVPESVPVFLGRDASRILQQATFFGGLGLEREIAGHYVHRQSFTLGPFEITPYLVDHSAYDAYALLIEAGGKRLFYSGDFRAHGHKKVLFTQLLDDPPQNIDVMLMEGTHVRPNIPGKAAAKPKRGLSEGALIEPMTKTFQDTDGLALIAFSAQNIDRLITTYKAARLAGRELVLDLYSATIAHATDNPLVPQNGWPGIRVWLPQRQRVLVKNSAEFERLNPIRHTRIFLDEIASKPQKFVLLFRNSMIRDLERTGDLTSASLTWSLWPGYLDQASGQWTRQFLERHKIGLVHHHSSGHAYIPDLQQFVRGLAPRVLVPVHSFAPGRFGDLFDSVDQKHDGEWWEVM